MHCIPEAAEDSLFIHMRFACKLPYSNIQCKIICIAILSEDKGTDCSNDNLDMKMLGVRHNISR